MRVQVTQKDDYWILKCSGSTVGDLPRPITAVDECLKSSVADIILDFSELGYLSSMGIKSLLDTKELVLNHGAHIGIAAPNASVRRALKLNGLTREIPIYYNLAEAVSKLDLLDYNAESWQENADMLLILQKDLPIAGDLRHAITQHSFNPGFRMKPVRNADEAYEVVLSECVDCILIDSTLQLFQVSNFIEKLRDTESIPAIPVLIVTRDDRIVEAEAMVKHGAHEILRLPFHAPEVMVRIGNAVSHAKDHKPYFPPKSIPQPRGWRL